MKIKVCGNTNIENMSEVIVLNPQMLGFIFYKHSKRYVGEDTMLMRFIASIKGIQKVGVFVNADEDEIYAKSAAYALDYVQLHGDESPEFCERIAANILVIKAFGISTTFNFSILDAYKNACSYFLFDTATVAYGGSGKTFDWALIDQYKGETPFLLSGGINPSHCNALKSISHSSFAGIDINSRFEQYPGIKNISSLKTFFHEIQY